MSLNKDEFLMAIPAVTVAYTPGSHCNSRRTLMSLHKCKLAWCSPNQLKMTPDSLALPPEQSPVFHHTRQVA